jgi:putative iron-regulated protein
MKKSIVVIGLVLIGLASCKKKKVANLKTEFQQTYADIVSATYQDSYNTAVILKSEVDAFVAAPSAAGFAGLKSAWLNAREPYGQTEAFRFASGPIDDVNGPEGLLNAWPMDEAYVDYVGGSLNSGIINDVTIAITKAELEGLNEGGGEKNISIGYHAIEFLLWGQDDSDTGLKTSGGRPYTDYVVGGTADNQLRRGEYLKICAELLVGHLELMVNEWKNGGAYRSTFLALEADVAVSNIMTGMGILGKSELAGERIYTALDNQDQEDEHSCFSDNTHRDIILNLEGIENIYLGTYTSSTGAVTSGTSLSDILEKSDDKLNAKLKEAFDAAKVSVNGITVPFDFALTQETPGGSGNINSSVTNLRTLGDVIAEAGAELDLTISTDLPE